MRSLTLPISTPCTSRIAATHWSACSLPKVAIVRSARSRCCPDSVMSTAVTMPPARSTAPVISLTAVTRAGSSSRTVMELDTDGTGFMRVIVAYAVAPRGGILRRFGRLASP